MRRTMNRRTFAAGSATSAALGVALAGAFGGGCRVAAQPPCPPRDVTPSPSEPAGTNRPPISLRVEPFIPTNLGDRVTGPTTIYVDAPGADSVWVYVRPMDAPYGGRPVGSARLVGQAARRSGRFAVPWPAEEPHDYVELFAVASDPDGAGTPCAARASPPVPILLDWRRAPPPRAAPNLRWPSAGLQIER